MKRSLAIVSFILVTLAAPAVMAQIDCSTCGSQPQQDCSTPCQYCADEILQIDICNTYAVTTCGDIGYACNRTDCTPDWQEISREVQGTYGEGWVVYCEHHRVEWVTQEDLNHCNTYSAYNYDYYCHDEMDGYKFATHSVDCCDGNGPDGLPDPTFTCNHYHHCTG